MCVCGCRTHQGVQRGAAHRHISDNMCGLQRGPSLAQNNRNNPTQYFGFQCLTGFASHFQMCSRKAAISAADAYSCLQDTAPSGSRLMQLLCQFRQHAEPQFELMSEVNHYLYSCVTWEAGAHASPSPCLWIEHSHEKMQEGFPSSEAHTKCPHRWPRRHAMLGVASSSPCFPFIMQHHDIMHLEGCSEADWAI